MSDTAMLTPRPQAPPVAARIDNANPIPSSSPAFGTPAFPILPRKTAPNDNASAHPVKLKFNTSKPQASTVLPVLIPPQTLRPIAFRTITKKHNLTLTSFSLGKLATFVGKFCGAGWREEGLAERVLDEVAKIWKRNAGGILLDDGKDKSLTNLLKDLEGCMSGGRIVEVKRPATTSNGPPTLSRDGSLRPPVASREDSQTSLGISALNVSDNEDEESSDDNPDGKALPDARKHMRIISAFAQPRLHYNLTKKFFEVDNVPPSMFPSPARRTALFRNRYNLIHQRLMRMESFQTPTFAATARGRVPTLQRSASSIITSQQAYKITPIANLLGRTGTQHLLLGLLGTAATGELALTDLTGSIVLDLSEASLQPPESLWACPGMIVLVEGIYDEDGVGNGSGRGGIGGVIGGRFVAVSVSGPPCERREVTLGIRSKEGENLTTTNAGFGWVDFLGVGSEKAIGDRMRRLEQKVLGKPLSSNDVSSSGRRKMVILGEVQLDNPRVLEALRKVLDTYAARPSEDIPLSFVLMGNFVSSPSMGGGSGGGSIEYKEHFDTLASIMAEFPQVLASTTFVFVPGDNDPWASAFSAGAATPLPKEGVPDIFTSRIRRAFATANKENRKNDEIGGEAIYATNPARLSLFGPLHEVVLFRDDISGRLRRNAILFKGEEVEEPQQEMDQAMNQGDEEDEPSSEFPIEVDTEVAEAASHQPQSKPAAANSKQSAATARRLVKTVVDQAYLSPFPQSIRPVHWDYAPSLHLYPLPSSLVLADAEAPPFAVTYEGCHVMNPGRIIDETGISGGRKGLAKWIEYDALTKRGNVKELRF